MRAGYTDNLRAILESQPAKARPILEFLQVLASDVKTTQTQWREADGTIGNPPNPPGFEILESGGVILEGLDQLLIEQTSQVGTPIEIRQNDPVGPQLFKYPISVEWQAGSGGLRIFRVDVFITNPAGANASDHVWCQLFDVFEVRNSGDPNIEWALRPASNRVRAELAPGTAQLVQIPLLEDIEIPAAPSYPEDPTDGGNDEPTSPTTVLFVWATGGTTGAELERITAANLSLSSQNVSAWEVEGANTEGQEIYTYGMGGPAAGPLGGIYTFAFHGRTFNENTVVFTNGIDLGKAPDADTALVIAALDINPQGTTVVTRINDGVSGFVQCRDGDVIGVDNTPLGGFDLSGVVRQQVYSMNGTLTPSISSGVSPRLLRLGVEEVKSGFVDAEVTVNSAEWAVDPITCTAEVPTAAITLRRDGVKDYRSFGEDLLSGFQLSDLSFRIWLGHDDIARADWLDIETYSIRNYDPSGDGIALDGVSAQSFMLELVPPAIAGVITPINYVDETVTDIWTDLHFGQVGVPERFLQAANPVSDITLTRTIDSLFKAIDLRAGLDFIGGGFTTNLQGKYAWTSLFDAQSPKGDVALGEYIALGFDVGLDRRIPTVEVPYGPSGQVENFATGVASDAILTAYAGIPTGGVGIVPPGIGEWLEDEADAQAIADRLINAFATGVPQMRIRLNTPRADWSLGDQFRLEDDRFIGYNATGAGPLRGKNWNLVRIMQQHDVLGFEWTVWVQQWETTPPAALGSVNAQQIGKGTRTFTVTYPGSDFQAVEWPEDYADETGMGGNVGKITGAWNFSGAAVELTAEQAGTYRATLPLPAISGANILETLLVAEVPSGTISAELVRHPLDGSASSVLASYLFIDTGRTFALDVPVAADIVNADSGYTVDVVFTLAAAEVATIYGYSMKIREILSPA